MESSWSAFKGGRRFGKGSQRGIRNEASTVALVLDSVSCPMQEDGWKLALTGTLRCKLEPGKRNRQQSDHNLGRNTTTTSTFRTTTLGNDGKSTSILITLWGSTMTTKSGLRVRRAVAVQQPDVANSLPSANHSFLPSLAVFLLFPSLLVFFLSLDPKPTIKVASAIRNISVDYSTKMNKKIKIDY